MEATVRKPRDDDLLSIGNIRINLGTYGIQIKEDPVDLTFHEFELLRALGQEPDRVVRYDALCLKLWHSVGAAERRRLNVTMCRLRSKLAASWPYRVRTVRGRGYGLIAS